MQINAYGHKNLPEGYYFPDYKDLWMTVVGALVCQVVRQAIHFLFMPIALTLSKVQDDEKTRRKYAYKQCECLFGLWYFTTSSIWGWYCLKDLDVMPWSLGGPPNGDFRNLKLNNLFWTYPKELYHYSLFTYGYHAGDFV